jgi:hypothetical protein
MAEYIKKEKVERKPLPRVGTKFMVNGIEYEVVYSNSGQNRFSSRPCEGSY